MGRYKRTSSRQSWDEENMKKAILAVRQKKMGWFLASKTYKVPATTLRRRAEKEEGWKKEYLGGYKITFNSDLEEELAELLKDLESRFFGLTAVDVRKLAYQIAISKSIPHRFSDTTKMAGGDWLQGFRNRNPSISLRTLQSTATAKVLNQNLTETYLKKLYEVVAKFKIDPNDIWNLLQLGLSTIPLNNSKNFGIKEKRQMRILTSTEKEQHLTTLCCMNAQGTFIPPALIFSRDHMEAELMNGAPTGSVGFVEENGWMTGNIFLKWLKHFAAFRKMKPGQNVLLLVDGHGGHKSYEALVYAKQSGMVLFCIPPNCTSHLVRPRDVDFHVSLNMYYNKELSAWIRSHPEETCTHFYVAELFREAYYKSATIKNAQSVFSTMNIFPNISAMATDVLPKDGSQETFPYEFANIPSTSPSPENKEFTLEELSLFLSSPQTEHPKCENMHRLQTTKKGIEIDKEDVFDMEEAEEDLECIYCNDLFSCSRSMDVWLKCQTCNHWCHADCAGIDQRIKM